MRTTYNGWTNRETWLINLWFGDGWLAGDDVDICREYCEEELQKIPKWLQDFVDIDAVNWDELREHALEIEKEEADNV